jgi:transposase
MMSLKASPMQPIPELTGRIARSAFPRNDNIYMKMRDVFGTVYTDGQFADLYPQRGQPAESPWRLALVTVMQYAENLTDRQAADAVRGRIDWKYALGLELDDPGFDFSVLSKFRKRLVVGGAERQLFEQMLKAFEAADLLKSGGKQRTDSTHILGAIRTLNRLELVGEALRQVLETVAAVVPEWLQERVTLEWFERYGQPLDSYRLPKDEKDKAELALTIGADGIHLLTSIYSDPDYVWLTAVPAVETMRRIWVQQYVFQDEVLRWRTNKETPPATIRIVSPFDVEARQAKKRDTRWLGYKVHLTETCDPDQPRLITHVETRIACQQDALATEDIHQALDEKQLLPEQHIVDTAYVSGAHLVTSEEDYGVDLLGPVLPDSSWQARQVDAYDVTRFQIHWEQRMAVCPQGHTSKRWETHTDRHNKPMVSIRFSLKSCKRCPARALCTTSTKKGRHLTVRPQAEHEAIQARRQYQETEAFREAYAARAGVEGVVSQAAYTLGLRRARYRGLEKTHLQNVATATAINLRRAAAWLLGKPTATTRITRFAALAPA